jgi:hypothetical protein
MCDFEQNQSSQLVGLRWPDKARLAVALMTEPNSPSWKQPFLEALTETDKERLTKLVHDTRGSYIPSVSGTGRLFGPS